MIHKQGGNRYDVKRSVSGKYTKAQNLHNAFKSKGIIFDMEERYKKINYIEWDRSKFRDEKSLKE